MAPVIVSALIAVPVTFLAWLSYNWAGKPILDVSAKRLHALKIVEQYGFVGYGYSEEEMSAARDALSDAATSLRSLSRGQPWSAKLYCRLLDYDLETAASVLFGLVGLVGAHLGERNSSRRDSSDAIHLLLNATNHLSVERITEIRKKLETTLALPRA